VGGGEDRARAPADGGVSRGSLTSSPPPLRPEPKRKKGGPPPFAAAAKKVEGMRTQGSSIPAKDPRIGGRDVMADIFSAISLIAKCAAGVMSLEYPAAHVAASPPPVATSPNVPGSTDGELEGRDDKDEGGSWQVYSPRASRRSPPVGGRPVGSRVEPPRPPRSSPLLKGGKPPVNCWGCGAAGHLLRRCPWIGGWCGARGVRSPAADRGGEPSPGAPGNVTGPPVRVALGLAASRPTPPRREADPVKTTDLAAHCGTPARGHTDAHRQGRQLISPAEGTAAAKSATAAKGARSRGAGTAVSRPAPEVIAPREGKN